MDSKQQSKRDIKCPSCSGRRIWMKGMTPTRQGEKQRYVCFKCGRTFYLPGAKFEKPRKRRE